MEEIKKYYVSAKDKDLDLGVEVEAKNLCMAVVEAYIIFCDDYGLQNVVMTEVEEIGL